MRYISLFSGIEAASVAWEPLGWEPVAFAEIEPFPCAVLKKRFPNVPNLGDVSKVDWSPYRGAVDVVVGGSPCQAFSIAGGRGGLLDPRGQLMLEFVRAVREIGPRFVLWENVPGVLSQDGGRAFGTLLRELEDCGLSCAWRVLDAQFVRVPVWGDNGEVAGWVGPVAQRRRRVFLVGHARVGCAAAVLFESQGVCGDFASSREEREELARRSTTRVGAGGERGCLTPWDVQSKRVYSDDGVSPTLNSCAHEGQDTQPHVMQPIAFKYSAGSAARTMPTYDDGSCNTLTADWHAPAACIPQGHAVGLYADETPKTADELSPTLRFGGQGGSNLCVAFAQNTRDEVRIQGDGTISGALSAQPGMKQTTYVCMSSGQANAEVSEDGCSPTLTTIHEAPIVLDRAAFNQGQNAQFGFHAEQQEVMETLVSRGPNAVCVRREFVTNSNGQNLASALCAVDGPKGASSQYVSDGKLVLERVVHDDEQPMGRVLRVPFVR